MSTFISDRDCCNSTALDIDTNRTEGLRYCFNIDTADDLFYEGKASCLPFTRSEAMCTGRRVREQFNGISSFIDASMVYGSDDETARRLRSGIDGELRLHEGPQIPVLPTRKQSGFDSKHGEHPEDLVAGDVRAMEQPGLASMHTLFLSEHNRIAKLIKSRQSNLSDEEIFQTARQIVGAEIQNIVYDEFLPVVLGNETMNRFNLHLPANYKDTSDYDSSEDPSILNEFATVAFRFGHSLIPNMFMPSQEPIRTSSSGCPLKDNFFKFEEFVIGSDMSGKSWQNLLEGILKQPSPDMDASMSNNVLDFLFCGENCNLPGGFGQDLAARNIQRGRDHGIPPYTKFRQICNLSVPLSWDQKPSEIDPSIWKKLKEVYEKVDDIDPFTGLLAEKEVSGGLVGPSVACVLGIQFEKLKKGDRYFFTHPNNDFSKGLPEGLKVAVRKKTLGDIICQNTDIGTAPRSVFQLSKPGNIENCSREDDLIEALFEDAKPTTVTAPSTGKQDPLVFCFHF